MVLSGILNDPYLIIIGYLDMTMYSMKFLGSCNLKYPMVDFVTNTFEEANIINVTTSVLVATWNNGWVGKDDIAKMLDYFILAEN